MSLGRKSFAETYGESGSLCKWALAAYAVRRRTHSTAAVAGAKGSGLYSREAGLICFAAAINTVQGHYTSRGADVSVQLMDPDEPGLLCAGRPSCRHPAH